MRRREFITLIGGAAAWPLAARAQQPNRVRHIGFLSTGNISGPEILVFRNSLRDLGYGEGQNFTIEWRFVELDALPTFANELVQLNLEAIVATGGPAVRAVQQATRTIPIIMSFSGDPVGTGLIASLARPGGNLTGLSMMSPDLSAKRVEVLREAFPKIGRVATLWNPDDPVYALELQRTDAAARALGITLQPIEVRARVDFEAAFAVMARDHADALIVFAHGLTISNRHDLVALANRLRLPTMYGVREYVNDGGLMSYGPNLSALYGRAAIFVDKVLKGAKPTDLPVEQPAKFELVINLKTAKAIGLTIPESLLLRADDLIE